MAGSKGLWVATCRAPASSRIGRAENWKATLVETRFRISVSIESRLISTYGQSRACASGFCRELLSEIPDSRAKKTSWLSKPPPSTADLHAAVQSRNWAGVISPAVLGFPEVTGMPCKW